MLSLGLLHDEVFMLIMFAMMFTGVLIALAMKMIWGGATSRRGRQVQTDEARLMQDLHGAFTRLEQRVETLETLIIEAERKRGTP